LCLGALNMGLWSMNIKAWVAAGALCIAAATGGAEEPS